jgi:DNA-directed RNA polymerase specialized sigma subunit
MSSENEDLSLSAAAKEEEQFVRERLKDELGREPTREEIDEWLREHTESY